MDLTNALEHYFKFEDNLTDTKTGVTNTIEHVGSSPTYAVGRSGQGIQIAQAVDDALAKNGGGSLITSSAFTISVWVKPAAFDATNVIIAQNESGAGTNPEWTIRGDVNGAVHFEVLDSNVQVAIVSSGNSMIRAGEWGHILARFDETGTIELNVYGKYDVTGTITPFHFNGTDTFTALDHTTATSKFSIGADDTSDFDGTTHFDGVIDELGIWSRVLTDDEWSLLLANGNGRYDFHERPKDNVATNPPQPMWFKPSPGEPQDDMMKFLFPAEPGPQKPPSQFTFKKPRPPRR